MSLKYYQLALFIDGELIGIYTLDDRKWIKKLVQAGINDKSSEFDQYRNCVHDFPFMTLKVMKKSSILEKGIPILPRILIVVGGTIHVPYIIDQIKNYLEKAFNLKIEVEKRRSGKNKIYLFSAC